MLFSPFEQFEILPIFSFVFKAFDVSITNQTIFLFLLIFLLSSLFFICVKQTNYTLFVIPHRLQAILELLYITILGLVVSNVSGKRSQNFFPLIFTLFFFISSMNIVGLIPYSYTVTSHFVVTFSISFFIFLGLNIICFKTHGIAIFSLFFPSGTSLVLALLLVPVELMSYMFKPLSLAVRLFCNMMAGHILIKVFAWFAFTLMGASTMLLFLLQYVPLLVLIPLFCLEFGVGFIQAFVFSLLTCLYLNDSLNLH